MPSERIWSRTANVAERTLSGETVLVPIRTSPHEKVSVLSLNATGSYIWSALSSPATAEALAAQVVESFEITADRARADVLSFLQRLSELGLAHPGAR